MSPQFQVVGLDLSLSNTGVATFRPGVEFGKVSLQSVTSKAIKLDDDRSDSYPPMLERVRGIAARVLRASRVGRREGDVVVYVIEGPSLGSTVGQVHTRAGLWWLVYHLVSKEGAVAVVPPKTLKKYITRNGNAGKPLMLERSLNAYPGTDFRGDDNLVDAHGLLAMACRELGLPIEVSTQRVDPGQLTQVAWPSFMEQNRRLTP